MSELNRPETVIEHGDICLYSEEIRVTLCGKELSLAPKEYKILELFMANPRRVLSREVLLEEVWGPDFVGDRKTVDVHIRWVREKIEDNPSLPKYLKTVRRFGYRLD